MKKNFKGVACNYYYSIRHQIFAAL
jgi:hypothetical protein